MASIDYEEIFGSFLGSVTDYNLASLDATEAYGILTELLHKALADRYVARLFSSKKLDDEIQKFTYEMKYVIDDDSDREFVIECLAKWMKYEWHSNKVNNVALEAQLLAGKEQKYYSQAAHLTELRALQASAYDEAYAYIRNRGYIDNKYLEGSKK
jgi:hypothetical protein